MFVYSMKVTTLKFFAILGIALIAVVSLTLLVPTYTVETTSAIAERNENIRFDGVKTNEDRIAFFEQYGWNVEANPIEEVEVTIPREFDKVMTTYNEIQKQQGLDLSKYAKRTMMRYTYKITNYPEYEGTVYYNRYILGQWCNAEGLIYTRFANDPMKYAYTKKKEDGSYDLPSGITVIGIDYGGTKSGQAFVCTRISSDFRKVIVLGSEKHMGDIDPDDLEELEIEFAKKMMYKYLFMRN